MTSVGDEDYAVRGGTGYFSLCAIGGMLSAGTTHLAITPLDVLKVNMQVHFLIFHHLVFVGCFCLIQDHQGAVFLVS